MPKVDLPDIQEAGALHSSDSSKSVKQILQEEYGIRRESLIGSFKDSEARSDTVDKEDYRKMWQNDGQVAAITKLPQLLILGAGFDIALDGEEEESEEVKFVKKNLTEPEFMGGMVYPIEDLIEDMCYAPFEGARYYELVWEFRESKYFIKKIAPRDNITCQPKASEHGDYDGVYQQVFSSAQGRTVEVFIPKEKSVAFIYNQAYGGLNGLSVLKPVWYHWDKKHKLYYISHLAAEIQTIPPVHVKHDGVKEIDKVNNSVDERGLVSRITTPMGVEINPMTQSGSPNVDIKALIDHHDSLIAKALLSQFIDYSTESSGTGSQALSKETIGLYLEFVQGIVRRIEAKFNNDIIPKLIDYNFGTGIYPKFKIKPIQDDKKATIMEVFKELVKTANNRTVNESILEKAAEELGLEYEPTPEEELQTVPIDEKDLEIEDANAKETKVAKIVKKDPELGEAGQDTVMLQEDFAVPTEGVDEIIAEALAPDELRIDVNGINKFLDEEIDSLFKTLKADTEGSVEEVLAKLSKILKSGKLEQLEKLNVLDLDRLKEVLSASVTAVYEFSKLKASNEIRVLSPRTTPEQKQLLRVYSNTNAQDLSQKLNTSIKNIVVNDYGNGVDEEETLSNVTKEVSSFINTSLSIAVAMAVTNPFNLARRDLFKSNENKIYAYRYTAVLDNRTTAYCRSLSGRVFAKNDPAVNSVWPPNHFRCRSTFSTVLVTDDTSSITFTLERPKSFGGLRQFRDTAALHEHMVMEVGAMGESV